MSYEVIARKWRPQVFEELIGQGHITQTLLNSLQAGRLPHALLLTGPRGTGKTSTARIFAKSLRCQKAKDFVPCNKCSDCEDIASSRSVDVIEIDGASNNGVDAIRELRDSVGFMPSSGKYKVYIIDEVHMLSGSAFNALLKTLEEPPAHVVFVLATTEVQKIPNTVLSRCQRYDFRKISTRLIAAHLEENCKAEKIKFEKEAIWALAKQGDGSMRDSQSLLDQVINFCNGNLTLEKVTEVLGLTDQGILQKTLKALIERDSQAAIEVVETLYQSGYEPMVFAKDLLEELRHLVVVKMAPDRATQIVDLPNEEIEALQKLGAQLTEEDVHLLFNMALKGAEEVYRAQDARIVLEMLLLRMAIAPRIRNLLTVTTGASVPAAASPSIAASKTPAQMGKTSKTGNAPSQRSATTIATPTASGDLSDQWRDFVDRVRKVNGLVAAQLDQLHLTGMKGKELEIGVPEKYKFLLDQVNDPGFHKKLVNYLNTFWGEGHKVTIHAINPNATQTLSPTKLVEKKAKDEADKIAKQVDDHPLVKQAKSIFNTQVKSIRENT